MIPASGPILRGFGKPQRLLLRGYGPARPRGPVRPIPTKFATRVVGLGGQMFVVTVRDL